MKFLFTAIAVLTFLALLVRSAVWSEPARVVENAIGMKLAYVPPGEFVMGSVESEKGRRADETRHRVRLTRGFYMGQYEVTIGQFRHFVTDSGYRTEPEREGRGGYGVNTRNWKLEGREPKYNWRNTGFPQKDNHPVVNVTWNDAVAFCAWLSRREKKVYRLPTEAEWEYACRAGTTTTFAGGDDPEDLARWGNIVDKLLTAKFPDRKGIGSSDGHVFTAPVGRYRPNAFQLYDMHGNVWEWCADWYGPYPDGTQNDPKGPASGEGRVIRGGDWYHDQSFVRCASRYLVPPNLPRRHGGFRVVMEP